MSEFDPSTWPPAFFYVIVFVFGALFGSFGNVVIYRLPKGESLAYPGSRCGNCGTAIRWYHNVPIFAWFYLRGKCAKCKAPYSIRYPFVEFLMGALFVAAAYRVGPHWLLVEYLIFIFGLVTASFIDIDLMILPDKITLTGIVVGLAGALIDPDRGFLDALGGVLLGGGFLWAIAYLYYVFRGRDGMGGGDIKLLAWIGAVLGWRAIPIVILVSSLIGSVVGIGLALRSKDGMQKAIPFGPYLAGAALVYMLVDGHRLAEWYLSFYNW